MRNEMLQEALGESNAEEQKVIRRLYSMSLSFVQSGVERTSLPTELQQPQ